ncbi:MAG TPA: TonB-dependent receptor [Pirellulales bacterium]|nr:TonB-dependent receptor [Pirellulales bacterium]
MTTNVIYCSEAGPIFAGKIPQRTGCGFWLLKTLMLLFLSALGFAVSSYAQTTSGIAGVATDSSGAVMPGVTVEIASPAMIEGSRTTATDANGQYKFIDLGPGVYSVTFTKPGFQTVRREGIALNASFTATVSATLPVGATATSVTVTEAAPIVDVQNSVAESVLTREQLSTIPTGKDPFAEGQILPGVTTSTPDVGGTMGMQQPTLQVHGSNGDDMVVFVDGIWIQHVGFLGNQTGFYFNDALQQNISYQFSALPAQAPVGGVEFNMVPRNGGNQFHGGVFGSGSNTAMESDNLTSALYNQGMTARNHVDTIYDINPFLGGPILRNKLWFFGSFRRWGANDYLANTFTPAGAQVVDDNRLTDATLRLTWQATKNNKFNVMYDRGFKFRGHRPNNFIGSQFSDSAADVVQESWMNYIGEVKWTGTLSDRLLAQVGYILMPVEYNLGFEPTAPTGAIAQYDEGTSTILVTSPRVDNDRGTMQTLDASLSYVTGSHNLMTGIEDRYGWEQESFHINGDQTLILNNGTPVSVRIYNTPLAHREDLTPDLGWYLQDSWHVTRRLTINPGIRFDHMVMSIPAQTGGGGMWAPRIDHPAIPDVVDWNTWSPRFGVVWDVFGDSRTAIKGSISKYDVLEGTSLAQAVNPNFIQTSTCPWTSFAEATPSTLDQSTCTGFPAARDVKVDPNLKRPYQWEYTAMVQRQIGQNTAVSVGYYGRKYFDLLGTVNPLVTLSDYTPISVTNPLTGRSMTIYNQNASTVGQSALLTTNIPALNQHYNGVEFQVNTRMNRLNVFGGFTIGKSYGTNNSGTNLSDPNTYINLAGNVGYDSPYQLHAGGSYNLPKGILFAFSVREDSGLPQNRTYTFHGLNQVSETVMVAPNGAYRYSWVNLIDIRFAKTFKVGEHMTFEPTCDIFNIFNNSGITSMVTTVGPRLGRPSQIEFGRLVRLGGRFNF